MQASGFRVWGLKFGVWGIVLRVGHRPEAGEGAAAVDLVEVVNPPNLAP